MFPQFASAGGPMYASTPSFSTPAGFIPPPQGYGVPTGITQSVGQTFTPSTLSGYAPQSQQVPTAGYSPMNAQPNYNMMMGGTTGYKSTMK